MSEQNTDVKSLAHTKWNCKYHVVFTPKSVSYTHLTLPTKA